MQFRTVPIGSTIRDSAGMRWIKINDLEARSDSTDSAMLANFPPDEDVEVRLYPKTGQAPKLI